MEKEEKANVVVSIGARLIATFTNIFTYHIRRAKECIADCGTQGESLVNSSTDGSTSGAVIINSSWCKAAYSSNRPGAKKLLRQGIEEILSPKKQ